MQNLRRKGHVHSGNPTDSSYVNDNDDDDDNDNANRTNGFVRTNGGCVSIDTVRLGLNDAPPWTEFSAERTILMDSMDLVFTLVLLL